MGIKIFFIFGIVLFLSSFVLAEDISKIKVAELNWGEEMEVVVKTVPRNLRVTFASGSRPFNPEYELKTVTKKELDELDRDPTVLGVYSKNYISAFMGESVSIVQSTSSNNLQANSLNLTGTGQIVCVVDTGINFSHSDLQGRNESCIIDCFDKACVENCSLGDDNGHGTHVAGIVGASGGLEGIAPNVTFIGIKILGSDGGGSGNDNDLNNAIDWCKDKNVSVITMSLGTTTLYDSSCDGVGGLGSWRDSINAAVVKNISVVIASGNDGNITHISAPACMSNAIAVGNIYDGSLGGFGWGSGPVCTDSTSVLDQIVCHANRNILVNLFAPGAMINSTKSTGGYEERGGTSMATPMVAGSIALVKQYLNLSGQTKTPAEVETILNNTGKRINDTWNSNGDLEGSNLNFSRIDVYSALLSLDVDAPSITLVSPADNNINLTVNQTFVCNATDWQLVNMTLKVWNSTGLYYNATNNLTGTANETSFNLINIPENVYSWNCLGVDNQSNSDYASANFSLTIGGISTTLLSPVNASHTSINDINFSCQVLSEVDYELANVTFYLWNSTGNLTYNETGDISGFDNTTVFNYTFLNEDDYVWNCLGVNNVGNSSLGTSNFTITYDITNPNLTITSSPSDATSNSVERSFGFNASDSNLANCSLIVNSVISLTNYSIDSSIGQSFSQTFTPETYVWRINCSDYASNINSSSENSFTITAPAITTGGGPSGGGSTTTVTPKVEVDETKTNGKKKDESNESNVSDEDIAEFFAHDEEPKTGGKFSVVLITSGSIVTGVLIILGIVMILYQIGLLKKTKKLKRKKTKKQYGKSKKIKVETVS